MFEEEKYFLFSTTRKGKKITGMCFQAFNQNYIFQRIFLKLKAKNVQK
jgi:hypothetical protein